MTHLLRRFVSVLVFLALAALTLLTACDQGGHRARLAGRERGSPPAAVAPTITAAFDVGDVPQFALGKLEQHFRKHGAEMGFKTQEDYLHAAQALLRGGPGVETLQRGGDTLFYREETNEFGVLSSQNVIRTYFRPRDGRRYWERQKDR